MNCSVLTPEKEVYSGAVKSVKVPGISGQFEVLDGHAPIVSALKEGEIRLIDTKGERISYSIKRGFIEVLDNEVSLLVQGLS